MNMLQLFSVGDTIYGYCNGFFGRDDYSRKICVMVAPLYAVFQYSDPDDSSYGKATVLNYEDGLTPEWVSEWKDPNNEN